MKSFSEMLLMMITLLTAQAFVVPSVVTRTPSPSFQLQAKNKGFGEPKSEAPKKKKAPPPASSPVKTTAVSSEPKPEQSLSGSISSPDNPFNTVREDSDMSQGKSMLERMRREKVEQRNAELRAIKEVKDVDAMMRETPDAAAIPERVAQRMGKRMLPFVGIPLFGGMSTFVGFWYMATYRDTQYEPLMVAISTIGVLVASLLVRHVTFERVEGMVPCAFVSHVSLLLLLDIKGITYSVMSASWDTDVEGSFLGTEEFSKNLGSISQGLKRSRENARLRDKARDVSDEELAALDRKVKVKKQVSFGEKIGDEFD